MANAGGGWRQGENVYEAGFVAAWVADYERMLRPLYVTISQWSLPSGNPMDR